MFGSWAKELLIVDFVMNSIDHSLAVSLETYIDWLSMVSVICCEMDPKWKVCVEITVQIDLWPFSWNGHRTLTTINNWFLNIFTHGSDGSQ